MVTPRKNACAVIVTVEAGPDAMPDLEAHARYGLTRFPEFSGFISAALHKSADGSRLVQYVCWRTEAEYLACVNDPQWDEVPSTGRFMQLIESGEARMDVRVYEVVASVP
ncbi:MAG: hypothetical protein ABFS14_02320 [Gemmatimonadota bacterium]